MEAPRILIDLVATQPNNSGLRHGGGKYGEAVFYRMVERGIHFSCFFDSRLWFNPLIKECCEKAGVPLYDIAAKPLQQLILERGFDVLYSCLPEKCHDITGCRIVGTLHDLRDLEIPLDWAFYRYAHSAREWLRFTVKKLIYPYYRRRKWRHFRDAYICSDMDVVTISGYTAEAIRRHYPDMHSKRIPVLYSPCTSRDVSVGDEDMHGDSRFILMVSAGRWEKNNLRAAIAFDRLLSAGHLKGVKMRVLGGEKGVFKYRFRHPEAFEYYGYVSEQELEKMYAQAWLFVYPSLSEGFGYPPLEALRYHTPVIASRLTSIPEVLGEGALYFDPFSVRQIMDRMMEMEDEQTYSRMKQIGNERFHEVRRRQDRDLDRLIDYLLGRDPLLSHSGESAEQKTADEDTSAQ